MVPPAARSIRVSHDSSVGEQVVCPPRGLGSIPSRDGHRQVVTTSPLEGYEEYKVIQLLLHSGPLPPLTIKMVIGHRS